MLQLVSTLHSLQVSLAVISDPCFGPGMRWPRWTGYDFFGQRTTKNNTVAILVAIEILHYVEVIPDVGDPRALWVKVHTSESDGPEFLLLAMYARLQIICLRSGWISLQVGLQNFAVSVHYLSLLPFLYCWLVI